MIRYVRNLMERVLVLVLASSDVRLGGLTLKWRDLMPIYHEGRRITEGPLSV